MLCKILPLQDPLSSFDQEMKDVICKELPGFSGQIIAYMSLSPEELSAELDCGMREETDAIVEKIMTHGDHQNEMLIHDIVDALDGPDFEERMTWVLDQHIQSMKNQEQFLTSFFRAEETKIELKSDAKIQELKKGAEMAESVLSKMAEAKIDKIWILYNARLDQITLHTTRAYELKRMQLELDYKHEVDQLKANHAKDDDARETQRVKLEAKLNEKLAECDADCRGVIADLEKRRDIARILRDERHRPAPSGKRGGRCVVM